MVERNFVSTLKEEKNAGIKTAFLFTKEYKPLKTVFKMNAPIQKSKSKKF